MDPCKRVPPNGWTYPSEDAARAPNWRRWPTDAGLSGTAHGIPASQAHPAGRVWSITDRPDSSIGPSGPKGDAIKGDIPIGYIPTLEDWFKHIQPQPWMNAPRKLSQED